MSSTSQTFCMASPTGSRRRFSSPVGLPRFFRSSSESSSFKRGPEQIPGRPPGWLAGAVAIQGSQGGVVGADACGEAQAAGGSAYTSREAPPPQCGRDGGKESGGSRPGEAKEKNIVERAGWAALHAVIIWPR